MCRCSCCVMINCTAAEQFVLTGELLKQKVERNLISQYHKIKRDAKTT